MGPPGVVQPAAAKVKTQVAYRSGSRVLLRLSQGIEQPRFLAGRSGAQHIFSRVTGTVQVVFLAEARQIQQLLVQREAVFELAGPGGLPLQRDRGEDAANAVPHRPVLQCNRLRRVPVRPCQVITVPILRDGLPFDGQARIEHRLAEQLRTLECILVNVAAQWVHTFFPCIGSNNQYHIFPQKSTKIFTASACHFPPPFPAEERAC